MLNTEDRCLVTGGAGYIGSHFAWALADRGIHVTVVDDLSTGIRSLVPPNANFALGDVRDTQFLIKVLREQRITTVAHFAAKTVVPESIRYPTLYYSTNTAGTLSVVEACIEAGVHRLVFSSTAAVYGDVRSAAVTEEAPLAPMSPYGASKMMAERLIRDAAAASNLRFAILRYFNVAGADPLGRTGQSTENATHLIKVAVETALGRRDRLPVYGVQHPTPDGSCVRDFIHVCDLVEAHLAALVALDEHPEDLTLNCGYGRGASVLEVIRAVEHVTGQRVRTFYSDARPGDPPMVISNPERLQRLGWKPRFDNLHDIVKHAYDWERALRVA